MNWIEIIIELETAAVEAMANRVHELDCGGVVIEHRSREMSQLAAYFPRGKPADQALADLEHLGANLAEAGLCFEPPRFSTRSLEETDWSRQWKEHCRPVAIGPVIIAPSWLAQPAGEFVVRLDPGMAFGTGIHPTTQLCVRELIMLVRPGVRVVDLGCGSGILSIVAARLGAAQVEGVDRDETAVRVARDNAAANGCQEQVKIALADALTYPVVPETRVVVANIGFSAAEQLLSRYRERPGKHYLVLSGFPREQLPGLRAQAASFFVRSRCKGEWGLLVAGQ